MQHKLTGTVELTEGQYALLAKAVNYQYGEKAEHFFLTQELAEKVLERHLPTMRERLQAEGRTGFAVVIANSAGDIVLVHLEGEPSDWKNPVYRVATDKSNSSYEHNCNSGEVPAHRIRRNSITYLGGVNVEGTVAAISGFSAEQDKIYGLEIGKDLNAECEADRQAWTEVHPKASHYTASGAREED